MNKNDEQKYLEEFNGYFPPWNRDAGIINQIQEVLERIKNMDSLEERVKEAEKTLKIHEENRINIADCWCGAKLWNYKDINEYDTKNKYERLVRELSNLCHELRREENTKRLHTPKERERERERERENKVDPNTINAIKSIFSQLLQLIQTTYGINSPQYQKAEKEQKEIINILEKSSATEQEQYLGLYKEVQHLLKKTPNLSVEEQTELANLSQKAEEFTEKLKEKQIKAKQQSKNNTNLYLGIGLGILGIGLIGLVVYLFVREKKKVE